MLAHMVGLRNSLILLCVLAGLAGGAARAQQPSLLSAHARKVKAKVEHLAPEAHLSMIPLQGEERFGNFVSKDGDGFTFFDVDQKANATVRYEEVKKIKDGYGGYNSVKGKHIDPMRKRLGIAIGAAVLVGLVIAVAVSV